MTHYHAFETMKYAALQVSMPKLDRPELVHLDDPAETTLWDFSKMCPHYAGHEQSIDHAMEEMTSLGTHWLFIIDNNQSVVGVLCSKDILGPKPLQISKQRDIKREQITCEILMTPINDIPCMDVELLTHAKVGHIVETLKASVYPYLFVTRQKDQGHQLCGIFDKLQINHQLHYRAFKVVTCGGTVAEINKLHTKK